MSSLIKKKNDENRGNAFFINQNLENCMTKRASFMGAQERGITIGSGEFGLRKVRKRDFENVWGMKRKRLAGIDRGYKKI